MCPENFFYSLCPEPDFNRLVVEIIFWAVLVLLALVLVRFKLPVLDRLESRFVRFSEHKIACVVLVGLLAPALRLAILPWMPIPQPYIHDELSYVLQGETFASGRLTNPPHPMGVFFETMHVNQWPTYQSMYPPGQGIFLGIGDVAFGHPWYGVVLSMALMCAATLWMLQGWLPPSYALLGGLFCLFRYATFSYWTNTYFGGAVAALAGALFFGALGRIRNRPTAGLSALFAFSLLLLANSRPYEGLMTSIVGSVAALIWILRDPMPWKEKLARFWLPAGLVMFLGVSAMLFYNWRGTGHPLMMPYQANFQKYRITNIFLWQKPRPIPVYSHMVMKKFYIFSEYRDYLVAHNEDMWGYIQNKIVVYYSLFVFPLFGLFIVGLREAIKQRRFRLIAISFAFSLLGVLVVSYTPQAHYAASATCLVISIFLFGIQKLRSWQPFGLPYGKALARVAIVASFATLAYETTARTIGWDYGDLLVFYKKDIQVERPRVIQQLQSLPGKHLLFVRYKFQHDVNREWVYNEPDIDGSKVVLAHDMGPARNQQLLNYYPDRQAWLIEADVIHPRLVSYSAFQRDRLPMAYLSSVQRVARQAKAPGAP